MEIYLRYCCKQERRDASVRQSPVACVGKQKRRLRRPLPPYQATGQLLISDFGPLGIRVTATVSGAETGWGAAAALESVFQSALP